MPANNGFFELAEFLERLAVNVAHQQVRLNSDYENRLKEFQPVFQLAASLGYEDIARAVAPMQISAGKTDIQAEVFTSQTHETEFAVGVKLLNLGYTRKYKYSKFVSHCLQLSVESLPLIPGTTHKKPPA
jgi:hypothetical protein